MSCSSRVDWFLSASVKLNCRQIDAPVAAWCDQDEHAASVSAAIAIEMTAKGHKPAPVPEDLRPFFGYCHLLVSPPARIRVRFAERHGNLIRGQAPAGAHRPSRGTRGAPIEARRGSRKRQTYFVGAAVRMSSRRRRRGMASRRRRGRSSCPYSPALSSASLALQPRRQRSLSLVGLLRPDLGRQAAVGGDRLGQRRRRRQERAGVSSAASSSG